MKKYYGNESSLINALLSASKWEDEMTEDEKSKMSYDEARQNVIERIFDDYKYIISDLEDEKYDLDETISDLEDKISELEDDIIDLEDKTIDSIFKNDTLIDLEKIEFINANWDKITYENLKKIV